MSGLSRFRELYANIDPDKSTTDHSIYAEPSYFPIVLLLISRESY